MKTLIVNSRYFPSAGPEKYLFTIGKVLEESGHEVIPFSIKNKRNLPTPYASYFAENIGGGDELFYENMDLSIRTKLQILDRQFYSFHVRGKLEALIEATKPDVAYILHQQNRLSPSVIDACRRRGVPVVMRISDFALVCTRNNLLREGRICELCISKGLFEGVRHRCVKGSFAASAAKAAALAFHRAIGIYGRVDRVVVPSKFTIEKLSGVLDPAKMVHLPTLVIPDRPYRATVGAYALFVGRIEEEKGLLHAIRAFEKTGYPLKIAGYSHTGYAESLKQYVAERGMRNVEFVGPKFGAELDDLYSGCRFVILPVVWYENLPNVALEAMLHGKPVVSSDIGSMREVVVHEQTGLLFEPGNSAACLAAVERLFGDDELTQSLGAAAYGRIASHYSPEKHLNGLLQVFAAAIAQRAEAG